LSKFDIVKFRHPQEKLAKFDLVANFSCGLSPVWGHHKIEGKKEKKEKKPLFTLGNYLPFVSFPSNRWTVILALKKKNPVYKNQGREPIHQKYKANESTSVHNPKKK